MTILSTEPRLNGLRRASDVPQSPSSVKSPSIYTNGAASVHAMPRPGPSNLLSRFIEQFRELEDYRYIDLYLLYHAASKYLYLGAESPSSLTAIVFPFLHLSPLQGTMPQ
jgi:hypothetical protein